MEITNKIYVPQMPMYEFETKDLPVSLKDITGEVCSTQVVGTKTYVRDWKPTDARLTEMKKGRQITVAEFEKLKPVESQELDAITT